MEVLAFDLKIIDWEGEQKKKQYFQSLISSHSNWKNTQLDTNYQCFVQCQSIIGHIVSCKDWHLGETTKFAEPCTAQLNQGT